MKFDYNKLAVLRRKQKISQSELGEKLSVSNQAISKWENGVSKPTIENLYMLAQIFGVSLEYFFETSKPSVFSRSDKAMESLTELYKAGRGPSSSHTIGPEKICTRFKNKNPDADFFKVTLFGSLAKTGRGHGTDEVIRKTLAPAKCEVLFDYSFADLPHPNTMDIEAFISGRKVDSVRAYSIGGGSVAYDNHPYIPPRKCYQLSSFKDISAYCKEHKIRLCQFVDENEDDKFDSYMEQIWNQMKESIETGLETEGILPGGLNVQRKAKFLFNQQHIDESKETRENRIVCSYAFAVSEQNAAGETIVTAPTCGSAGVVPSVLYYQQQKHSYSDDEIINALKTAGIIGNLIKTNASISGAECGCQVEIGSACAMAAAALGELFGLNIDKIEYAAEIAIEHHLGLTCDPICGLVQIPCIERNAVAAMRAINSVNLASFLSDTRKISFDTVVRTMYETGKDISSEYKETSEGGLAKVYTE
ncbi:MAG: L-serine ammonia-lyase [Clostridia bacterium]|nr:L-serine ammonia-lyase [Clostridia bacterium]